MSLRFPIGVATMYNPSFKLIISFLFSFIIYSCTPHNILNEGIFTKEKNKTGYKKNEQIETIENINKTNESNQNKIDQIRILPEIEIICNKLKSYILKIVFDTVCSLL